MRVRTEVRRQAILQAAIELFREVGFERASMSMITERVGGSKSTLYGYFSSKEELFAAAMLDALTAQGERILEILDPAETDFRAMLHRYGQEHVRLICSDDLLANTRVSIAEGGHQKCGASFYEQGPKRMVDKISAYMSHLAERGDIQTDDPHRAAVHFHGLLEAGILMPMLMGAEFELKLKDAAKAAVDTFLRAYASKPCEESS